MRLSFTDLVDTYNLQLTGILHLGTSSAREAAEYAQFTDNVVWLEANPQLIPKLERAVGKYGQRVFQALLGDRDGQDLRFHVTDNFSRSSVKEISRKLLHSHDIILKSNRLDSLVRDHGWTDLNFLTVGIHGAELMALKGAPRYIEHVDYVYVTEVDRPSLVDEMLYDFIRIETASDGILSDAFWVRRGKRS